MKRLIYEFRSLIAETLIGWSLSAMPNGADKFLWARHVDLYMRGVHRRLRAREKL